MDKTVLIVEIVGFLFTLASLVFVLKEVARISERMELLHSATIRLKEEMQNHFDHVDRLLDGQKGMIAQLTPPQPRDHGKFVSSSPKPERARSMSEARLMAENGLVGSAERKG